MKEIAKNIENKIFTEFTEFERCNIKKCTFEVGCSFDRCNIIECDGEGLKKSTLEKSNIIEKEEDERSNISINL